jgi:hypothetical protein
MWRVICFRSRENNQFYFRIASSNGKTIAQSEGYLRKIGRDAIAERFADKLGAQLVWK